MSTAEQELEYRIRSAGQRNAPLVIRGGGSKDFLGRRCEGDILDVTSLRGIVRYEPTELVITARAGTPLSEIESALAQRGQMLGFEPPQYGATATLGGTIACGLSGPARPFCGAARDFVLGVKMINGRGEILTFGGEVMKNVAGYDISRLMCGAYGTLGVLLDVSLRVLPRPPYEIGLVQELTQEGALERMHSWQRRPLPLSGLCYDGARLHVRLAGAEKAVTAARRQLGGETEPEHAMFWNAVREQDGGLFAGAGDLWRLSVPSTTERLAIDARQFIDWGGALRWLRTAETAERVFAAASAVGGHAQRYRGAGVAPEAFQPLPMALMAMHRRLKQAFDPHGIFNRGRMYPEL